MNLLKKLHLAAGLALGTAILGSGCTGQGRFNKNQISAAELRMNQIRSATDWEMAESAFLAGDFDRAQQKLERSIALNPGVAQAHELLGRVFLEQGDLEESRRSLLRATLLDPTRAQAHYALGIIAERLQDLPKALEQYQTAADLAPNDAVFALAVVEALIDLDRLDDASAFLDERSSSYAYNAGVLQARGHLALMRGDPKRALKEFQDARLLDPDRGDIAEDLARAQASLGHHPQAIRILEDLLEEPDFENRRDLRRQLARSYVAVDRLIEARSTYLDIIADPAGAESAGTWHELGSLAHEMNDTQTLGRAGRRLMALAPQDAEGYVYRAIYYRDTRRAERAVNVLEQAIRRDALDADGLVLLGLILADSGHADNAMDAFRAALESDPSHSLASVLVGQEQQDTPVTSYTPTGEY